MRRLLAIILPVIVVVVAVWVALPPRESGWVRDDPLVDPIAVVGVSRGVLTLETGEQLTPAGVRRGKGISAEEFDRFLTIATAQGVLVIRDYGDGRAMLRVEPRFWNWCGNSSRRWPGSFVQSPLSELAIIKGYAVAQTDQLGLTPREKWRLEGCRVLAAVDEPVRLNDELVAIRFDINVRMLPELDVVLGMYSEPPEP